MTLVVVSQISLARGPSLLIATDSVLSAGYRWPRGPKLFPLGAHAIMAFEGDTELAYPLLINARNFITFSDNLSSKGAGPSAIFSRVQMDVSEAYAHLVQSKHFDGKATCSLILAGWSYRLGSPVVWQLNPPTRTVDASELPSHWQKVDVVSDADWQAHHCIFAGSGDRAPAARAWEDLKSGKFSSDRFTAYSSFLSRVQDPTETAVGGVPQVALLSDRKREILGIIDSRHRRYLLGHYVPSGAYNKVHHYDADLTGLQ